VRRAAALALLLLAAGAPPAGAAYAPQLEVRVDPAKPSSPSATTFTTRQARGEAATRSQVVRLPPQFAFNTAFSVAGCGPADEQAGTCPASSRVGYAVAEAEALRFAGDVFATPDFRLLVFLHSTAADPRPFAPAPEQRYEVQLRLAGDGWLEAELDDLPPIPTTFSQLRMESSYHALVVTPPGCGIYPVEGRFLSHDGDRAVARASVEIRECQPGPDIAGLEARPRRRALDVRWRLAGAGRDARLTVDRRVRARPWVRWSRVRTLDAAPAAAGPNRTWLAGLAPGRYRVTLVTRTLDGAPADFRRVVATVARLRAPASSRGR
jgi:hypothetical protein